MGGTGTLLFGGTFDPPHRAHATLPPLAADQLGCDQLIYIPASINPLKADTPPTPAQHRRAMLELAIRNVPDALVSTVELDRPGPSYFVDTVRWFREQLGPDAQLFFLIGSDQALEFDRWKDWREILELAAPAVMIRPQHDGGAFERALELRGDDDLRRYWVERVIDVPIVDCSSTDIRQRLLEGDAVAKDVDPAVMAYIREQGLYGT